MSVWTLNYTNRKRIRREDARVIIREEKNGSLFRRRSKACRLRLARRSSHLVEAYRQTQYTIRLGQVSSIRSPEDRRLTDFDTVEGVLFRSRLLLTQTPWPALGRS
jgi:hypothetical protein